MPGGHDARLVYSGEMDLTLAYTAGLLTLINPCVLPILPVVISSALTAGRFGPVALMCGMTTAFVAAGLTLPALGLLLDIHPEAIITLGATGMIIFGLFLVFPWAWLGFSVPTHVIANTSNKWIDSLEPASLRGQFIGGALLGLVWTPCVGPTLGAALSLAFLGENLSRAGFVMTAFALGTSTVMLLVAYVARSTVAFNRESVRALARVSRPVMGVVFIVLGTAVVFGIHYLLEFWLLLLIPEWIIDLSVSY